MRDTARHAFVAAVVVGGVIVGGLVLWQLRILVALLFLAFTMAAAMRPGVTALKRHGVPPGTSIAVVYVALVGLLALLLSLVVPSARHEIQSGLGGLPTSSELESAARHSTGFKQQVLLWAQEQLQELPTVRSLIDPALTVTLRTFEVLIGIFFTLACAAYWIFERDRTQRLVLSVVPPQKRAVVRDTWRLIDRKLGAYVRGQGFLILLVGAALSLLFWLIGLPYYILLGITAGVLEVIPVIGPLVAGALAVGIGFTVSWKVALAAGLAVLIVRMVEDYVIIPRVLGGAVGLSPLIVLVSVSAVAILFGGFAVLLAIPLAAALATLVEVIVRGEDLDEDDGDRS